MATTTMFTCKICCEEFDEEGKITLACNPEHTFCRTCIVEWYNICAIPARRLHGPYITKLRQMIPIEHLPFRCPVCSAFGGCIPMEPGQKLHVDDRFIYYFSRHHCFCRENETHFCCTYTGFSNFDPEKKKKDCTIILEDDQVVSVCPEHYRDFMMGQTVEHYVYGKMTLVRDFCQVDGCYRESTLHGHSKTDPASGKTYPLCPYHHRRRKQIILFRDGVSYSAQRGFFRAEEVLEASEEGPITLCGVPFATKKGICKRGGLVSFGGKCHIHRAAHFQKADV